MKSHEIDPEFVNNESRQLAKHIYEYLVHNSSCRLAAEVAILNVLYYLRFNEELKKEADDAAAKIDTEN